MKSRATKPLSGAFPRIGCVAGGESRDTIRAMVRLRARALPLVLGLLGAAALGTRTRADDRPALEAVAPADAPPFDDDDLDRESLRTALREEKRILAKKGGPVSLGGVATTRSQLLVTLERFEALLDRDSGSLAAAVASSFACYRSTGSDGQGTVLFTGYHAPCYEGSRTKTEKCRSPLRRAPSDPRAFTRREIELEGKLDGRGLELVWLARRLDAYLMEVQGSGSVRFEDGTIVRVHCSQTNGRPYTSLGKELVKDGKVAAEKISIPAIRDYFAAHPEDMDEYLCRNASYVFFEETTDPPRGCAGAAVTAKRSIATDKKLFPAGALAFIVVEMPVCEKGRVVGWKKRARFVLDEDTGGAIQGAGRVDIYMGEDEDADAAAGVMKREGRLYYLLAR